MSDVGVSRSRFPGIEAGTLSGDRVKSTDMHFLFIFLDGVGLGDLDAEINPLVQAEMPTLRALLGGSPLANGAGLGTYARATLLALDATLEVPGLPQSATGQATLLTGRNIPAAIGYHYGPKPNPAVRAYLDDTLFTKLVNQGCTAALLNAYPPGYFEAIQSGRRLYSAIPQAVVNAGIPLKTAADLVSGRALAADFTAEGWHKHLGLTGTPLLSPEAAGARLAQLAKQLDFSFFEYWLSDYAGHDQDMKSALGLLKVIDGVLAGLLDAWEDDDGLILLTSDHGNLEDLSTRRHTSNPVPALLIGSRPVRSAFASTLTNLADIAPAVLRLFA